MGEEAVLGQLLGLGLLLMLVRGVARTAVAATGTVAALAVTKCCFAEIAGGCNGFNPVGSKEDQLEFLEREMLVARWRNHFGADRPRLFVVLPAAAAAAAAVQLLFFP